MCFMSLQSKSLQSNLNVQKAFFSFFLFIFSPLFFNGWSQITLFLATDSSSFWEIPRGSLGSLWDIISSLHPRYWASPNSGTFHPSHIPHIKGVSRTREQYLQISRISSPLFNLGKLKSMKTTKRSGDKIHKITLIGHHLVQHPH